MLYIHIYTAKQAPGTVHTVRHPIGFKKAVNNFLTDKSEKCCKLSSKIDEVRCFFIVLLAESYVTTP